MAASPPAPTPMSAAARQPAGKLVARASRKMPSAVIRFIASATRGPKNRSSSHPTTILPSRLDPPRIGCVLRQRGGMKKGTVGVDLSPHTNVKAFTATAQSSRLPQVWTAEASPIRKKRWARPSYGMASCSTLDLLVQSDYPTGHSPHDPCGDASEFSLAALL
jgi:hypothetical protein